LLPTIALHASGMKTTSPRTIVPLCHLL